MALDAKHTSVPLGQVTKEYGTQARLPALTAYHRGGVNDISSLAAVEADRWHCRSSTGCAFVMLGSSAQESSCGERKQATASDADMLHVSSYGFRSLRT